MNATIQEIEGIDDYWGPAFRSVYEGEGHEAFVQQLDERIVQHDKEIEKLCNFHYQRKAKKRKRGRRSRKLKGVEDQPETLQSMSQYEDNNNHILKRRCIDPKRLGDNIYTLPGPDTQCEPSYPLNPSKVSDHDLCNENLEETSEMGISSDEYEEITKYHTLQTLNQDNHQLMSKEPYSSTDDLRLYLCNRNRLRTSVEHKNLEETSNRLEQQSDFSSKDSADRQISTRDRQPVVNEVDVNSSDDLRAYLRSKLSDEQYRQRKSSYAEHYQGQREAIQYDESHNHQVEHNRELRQSLFSKYDVGPKQYDDIRYEKGQSRRASVERNKDQIRSLSTERVRTQNRHETIEYDRDHSRTLSSERTSGHNHQVEHNRELRQSLFSKYDVGPKQYDDIRYEKGQSRRASVERNKDQIRSLSMERVRTQNRHETIEYDRDHSRTLSSERTSGHNHQVEHNRELRQSLFSKYDVGPKQYDDIRYEKGQSRRASVERNKDQIRSLSTERVRTQNRHETIEYDRDHSRTLSSERTSGHNHQVEHNRELRQSLFSKYDVGPKQYDDIRYEKGQSRRASVERNKDQIRSLSTERVRTQNRHETIEYDRDHSRTLSSERTSGHNHQVEHNRELRQSLFSKYDVGPKQYDDIRYEKGQSRRASVERNKDQIRSLSMERVRTQNRHETIEYDRDHSRTLSSERTSGHNHQVEHNRELRQSLFSKYDVGPKQYDDIRYEKGQSRRASVERNKDQIRSLSTERVRTQNRHETIEYDRDHSRTLSSERTSGHNHQVEHNRELRQSLFSKYDVGPKQYDDIRYEKGQSRRASVERNKDQIRSLSTERVRTQNRHETIEYDRDHSRTLSSERTSGHNHQVEHNRELRQSLFSKYDVGPKQYDDIRYEKGQSRRASVERNKDQIRSLSSERVRTQNRHENIEYDRDDSRTLSSKRTSGHNHQVEHNRELRQSLFSKYDVGPKQYDDIRYEKGQSRRASVERNKDQIRSLSTERVTTQNRHETIQYDGDHSQTLSSERTTGLVAKLHEKFQSRRVSPDYDKVQRSLSSERNRRLGRHDNFECDRGKRQHVASMPENSQSPYSLKEHIRPRTPHIISERDGINSQNVFSHQLRGQSHHSAEYDSGDSYSRGESTGCPKFRSRPTSTEHNIRRSRPSSSEYKQSFHPIIEYHKHQTQEQVRGSRRISTDYGRKTLSSQESTDYDRGQGQALAERRRIDKSKPERGVQEKSHAPCDKKSQSRPSSSEHFVQSGQATEYTSGRKRSDSSEGHGSRIPPVSADNNIQQNRLSYSEIESQICHKLIEVQKSRKGYKINECFRGGRGSLLSDHISDVQADISSADITTCHNRSNVSANFQLEKSEGYPNRYHVDDRPLTSDIGRQVSSETCIKHHLLLPETPRETYRKFPDREDLSPPLSTQRQPTSVQTCKITLAGQHNSAPANIIKANYEECPAIASSIPCHSVSNRVTSSQFFQNEILEHELSHVQQYDIEKQSFDRPQKKPNTTELKSCKDGMLDAPETEILSLTNSSTVISMDVSTPRSKTPLSTTNPQDQNAINDSLNKGLSSKLTNHIEASVLLTRRGSSEPREHGRESFAEMSSIQDISESNHDSVETVIVDLDLKTDDVRQCTTPEPDVNTDLDRSYDVLSLNASNESSKVTVRHIGQDNKDPELKRPPESNVKSEPIDHNTIREMSSADDKIIAQNRQQEETPDYCHKFPGHGCKTATPSGFIKLQIKQEPDNDTVNSVFSTLETDIGVNSFCGPNNEDKQGQATAESSQASSYDGSFKVSVGDVNSINALLNGAKIDPFNAVLNKTNECEDDHIKKNVSAVTADSWYPPRKITLEKYPNKQKEPSIFALVNSCDPRLQPRIKRVTKILNEQETEVLGDVDVAQSEINIKSDNTVLIMKHYIHTSSDCQNESIKPEERKQPIVPNLAGKCGKLVLDILKSSKDNCCSSNKVQISPESPQIQDEQLFTSLKPMDIETQVAEAIPIYDSANKNHNINDWIDSVNKVAATCNWSDQQVVGYAIPKIMGNGFDSNISWIGWQEKLRTAFPSKVNYGKMLLNMLNTTAKVGDSLVEYFYEKQTLLDKCNITGEKAIECMIFGIEDESVRTILESLVFENQEQLLTFFSNFKN